MITRITSLNRYQKGVLVLVTAMMPVFTAVYSMNISRVGLAYKLFRFLLRFQIRNTAQAAL